MNDRQISQAITHRFAQWQEDLEARHATPILVLALTSEHDPRGERCIVCGATDLSEADVLVILTDALICLRDREVTRDPQ